jgi:hypothetical protein
VSWWRETHPINKVQVGHDDRGVVMDGETAAFALLRSGVPLSLLLDLASPEGPDSREIARSERVVPKAS